MIYLMTALPSEAAALSGHTTPVGDTQPLAPGLTLHVCGVGAANATRAGRRVLGSGATRIASEQATALISVGVAGALTPGLRAGEVIVADAIVDATATGGRELLPCDPVFTGRLVTILSDAGLAARRGRVVAAASVVATPEDKQRQPAGIAVDMESAALALAAEESHTAFACLRVIVDEVDMHIPRVALDAMGADGHVNPAALLRGLVRRRGEIVPLVRLGLAFARARRSLRRCGAALRTWNR